MKKTISLLIVFAVMASFITVRAVDNNEVFTYDGSDPVLWTGAENNYINAVTVTDSVGDYTRIAGSGDAYGRIYLELPESARLEDDYVIEYDINMNKVDGMGRLGYYNQIAFISEDAALDTNNYGEYAAALGEGSRAAHTGLGYTVGVASSITSIYGITSSLVNYTGKELTPGENASGMLSGRWYRVQSHISGSTAEVKIIGSDGSTVAAGEYINSAYALNRISVSVGRSDEEDGQEPGCVLIDNIRIYSGGAQTLTASGLRTGNEMIPTPTPLPAAAEIENTYVFDYETDDALFDPVCNAHISASLSSPDIIIDENGETVLMVTADSGNVRAYADAGFDLTPYTEGKSHIILSYDAYFGIDGRMVLVAMDRAAPLKYSDYGILSIGIRDNKTFKVNSNIGLSISEMWIRTIIDIDLTTGEGSYELTRADDNSYIYSDSLHDIKSLKSIHFISWSPNTSYIDNIKIETGGEYTEPTASPEPASKEEGSHIDLLPAGAKLFGSLDAAEAVPEVKLNHSNAQPAEVWDIDVYDSEDKFDSRYVYFDVLVKAGDTFTVKAMGNSNSLGTSFVIGGNEDGTASVYAICDKGDKVIIGTLVCETWYRVLIEIPQIRMDEKTANTGNASFMIYRIDGGAPLLIKETALQADELTPRNLAARTLTKIVTETEGTPYIDNGVVFMKSAGYRPGKSIEVLREYKNKASAVLSFIQNGVELTVEPYEGVSVKPVTMYIAEYNDDETLLNLGVYPTQLSESETEDEDNQGSEQSAAEESDTRLLFSGSIPENGYYKLMLWDAEGTPLIEPITDLEELKYAYKNPG